MEPAMVLSRNQIEERRKKAQQKREEKATQRQVKKSKRYAKFRPRGVDLYLSKMEDKTEFTDVPNVPENDLNLTDGLFLDSDQTEPNNRPLECNQPSEASELPYVTLDYQFMEDLVNQPLDNFANTFDTTHFEDIYSPDSSSTQNTIQNEQNCQVQYTNAEEDQDSFIELIESLLN